MDELAPPPGPAVAVAEDLHTGTSVATLQRAFLDHLCYQRGRHFAGATRSDYFLALAYTVRDRMVARWIDSMFRLLKTDERFIYYLSAEFLMGPQLGNNLVNLGLLERTRQALHELGIALDDLLAFEEEPGLGNGGLGRLAACYMDSLATLGLPAVGYGIRYEFGMFDQEIRDGWQAEVTDKWLRWGNPWEIERPEKCFEVNFGGHTETWLDEKGHYRVRWIPEWRVRGVAHDTLVLGGDANSASLLRLWRAEAMESFDFGAFNSGDYARAVEAKVASETISKVLYPNDSSSQGRRLRLQQQFFFVTCSLQDMISRHLTWGGSIEDFGVKNAVQLNDTHPSIAVAELMRLLLDEHGVPWEKAWEITTRATAYTNHTLLPEALEKWPLALFGKLLPRHLEIIYEINRRFLDQVRTRFPGDAERVARMSLIEETDGRAVRMAHLAVVGSHAVNGVAALHSELLRRHLLRDFHELWPERIVNVTNGVTPRRWVVLGNPGLARLLSARLGEGWPAHMERLRELEAWADEPDFQLAWQDVKRQNKLRLTPQLTAACGVAVDPASLFAIQVKRIHEYKRQHLSVLEILTRYLRLKEKADSDMTPRTYIFAGKAAPGYHLARLIVKLIHAVAAVVNHDPVTRDRLRVVFLPDFNVKLAEPIYPAADLSVQISTAGKEASGTGNMKFMMNGALTIGTLDGANVEIREEVGADNFFLFGHTADQVEALWAGGYHPREWAGKDPELAAVLAALRSDWLTQGNPALFQELHEALLDRDSFVLLPDYAPCVAAQERVDQAWADPARWTRMSILNVARSGHFSSDRSIRDYCARIWGIDLPEEARP